MITRIVNIMVVAAIVCGGAVAAHAEEPPDIIWQVQAHYVNLQAVTFSPDGQLIASGSNIPDPEVQVRSAADGSLLHTVPAQASGVTSLAFSPVDAELAVGGVVLGTGYPVPSGVCRVWKYEEEELLHSFGGGLVSYSADGSLLASAGLGVNRYLYVHQMPYGGDVLDLYTGDYIVAMDLSPDGSIAATGDSDGPVYLWDVGTGTQLDTLSNGLSPHKVVFSPDGELIAAGHANIKVWNVADGQLLHTLSGGNISIPGLEFSSNGAMLISASTTGSYGRRVELWRVRDGALLASINVGYTAVLSVAMSPDRRTYVYGLSNGMLTLARTPVEPADLNVDGDVDVEDHAVLFECMGGPDESEPMPGCAPANFEAADFDGDGDVDLADFAQLQELLS